MTANHMTVYKLRCR